MDRSKDDQLVGPEAVKMIFIHHCAAMLAERREITSLLSIALRPSPSNLIPAPILPSCTRLGLDCSMPPFRLGPPSCHNRNHNLSAIKFPFHPFQPVEVHGFIFLSCGSYLR